MYWKNLCITLLKLASLSSYCGDHFSFSWCSNNGANYAIQAPAANAANAPGEWNHAVIIVNKGDVEHWLNGKKLLEYQIESHEWKKQKEAGKWKTESGYGAAARGHIALQAAHSEVDKTYICFKNIKIKLL